MFSKKYFLLTLSIVIAVTADAKQSSDSLRKFSLSGYGHIRFQSFQESEKPDGLDIRRVRLDFKGLLSPAWEYRLQLDVAGAPKILDAVVSYKYREWLKVSAGQFKLPFSTENLIASTKLETIERSQVQEALVARSKDVIGNQNGRDLGLQLSGSLFKLEEHYLLDYAVGIFDGAGINVSDNNESKDLSGRLLVRPSKNLEVGGSYYNGFGKWGTPAKEQVRARVGAEFSYTYRIFNLKGEFIEGLDGAVSKDGWFAQLSAFVYKKNVQLVVKYDTYDPNLDVEKRNDISVNYTFGTNLYFSEAVRLQINYTNRIEGTRQINNDIIAAQLQIGF